MERHQEYIRILPGAKTAVLLIHGIVGTPDHFRKFIPLISTNWSVYNVLLDGHGKEVGDFAKTSMIRWKAQISEILKELKKNHQNIIIVAHSMGTLFAIDSAVREPNKISHLFLMASPLLLRPKPISALTSIRVLFERIDPSDARAVGAKNAYGIKPDKKLWKYFAWIPRYLELFTEIHYIKRIIMELKTPCMVYQSKHDELVSHSSVKILQRNPEIKIYMLHESGHFHLTPKDEEFVLKEFQTLCNSIKS